MRRTMMAWPGVTNEIADQLLSGKIEYTVEDETVVFTV